MDERAERPTTAWGNVQRRVRRLAPRPIRRADLAIFRALARTEIPVIGPMLPPLTRSANHSRLWIVIAALLSGFGGRYGRRAGARGLVSIAVTSAVTNLPVKLLAGRVRPELAVVPEIRRLARVPASTSFPSGHSASAFAFATAASLEMPRLRLPLLTAAAAVATSRVYTGVHYPGDVLVGSAIGAAIARATTRPWPLADTRPATAPVLDEPRPPIDPDGTGVVMVANAAAGNALSPASIERLRAALPGIEIIEAQAGEELPATLRRAATRARVLGVAGGDGSASIAASIAHEAGIPLLLLPTGTLNHLARDLGIESFEATVRGVLERRVVRMDLGEIDGRAFVNAASVGAYPRLVASRERVEEYIGKWPAALWSALRILGRGTPTEIDIDGRRRRMWLLFIGNGRYSAEGIAPAHRRQLDSGVLDIRLVHAERPWARTRLFLSVLSGNLGSCASYERWTTEELHLRSPEGPLRLATDGESWWSSQEFTVCPRPLALQVIQPAIEAPAERRS